MSFTRANVGGWAAGAKVTTTQLNALDLDHSRALDKVNGDTLAGVVSVTGAGAINLGNGTKVDAQAGSSIIIESTATCEVKAGGALVLDGTVSPTFGTPRNVVRLYSLSDFLALSGTPLAGVAGYTTGVVDELLKYSMPDIIDGATLTLAELLFVPKNTHAGKPNSLPVFSLFQRDSGGTLADLCVTGPASYQWVDLTTYNANVIRSITYTPNQHNVIDRSQLSYVLEIEDEKGTNAIAGNTFVGLRLTYSATKLETF